MFLFKAAISKKNNYLKEPEHTKCYMTSKLSNNNNKKKKHNVTNILVQHLRNKKNCSANLNTSRPALQTKLLKSKSSPETTANYHHTDTYILEWKMHQKIIPISLPNTLSIIFLQSGHK